MGPDVNDPNQYILSFNHDGTPGATRIWGEYTLPNNTGETPQTEGSLQLNYADASWPDSFTAHGYSGTGTEDTNLNYTYPGGIAGTSDAYIYRIVCDDDDAIDCDAGAGWAVYRYFFRDYMGL